MVQVKAVEPCCMCGTKEGFVKSNCVRPTRIKIPGRGRACVKCHAQWRYEEEKKLVCKGGDWDPDLIAQKSTEIRDQYFDKLKSRQKRKVSGSVGLEPTFKNLRKIRRLWHSGKAWTLIFHPGTWGATANGSQPGEVPLRPSVVGDPLCSRT